jgi:hypothetical protein
VEDKIQYILKETSSKWLFRRSRERWESFREIGFGVGVRGWMELAQDMSSGRFLLSLVLKFWVLLKDIWFKSSVINPWGL